MSTFPEYIKEIHAREGHEQIFVVWRIEVSTAIGKEDQTPEPEDGNREEWVI